MKFWVWCASYFFPQDTWKWAHAISINKECIHVSPSCVNPGCVYYTLGNLGLLPAPLCSLRACCSLSTVLAASSALIASSFIRVPVLRCTYLFRCFTAGFRGLSLTCHWERPLMAGAIKASMFFSCWCSMCVWDRITLVKIWVIRNHLGNGGDFFPSGKCWTFFWDNRKITSTLLKWHTALGQSKQSKHPLSTQANEDRAKGKCSLGNYRPKSRPMKPSWDS